VLTEALPQTHPKVIVIMTTSAPHALRLPCVMANRPSSLKALRGRMADEPAPAETGSSDAAAAAAAAAAANASRPRPAAVGMDRLAPFDLLLHVGLPDRDTRAEIARGTLRRLAALSSAGTVRSAPMVYGSGAETISSVVPKGAVGASAPPVPGRGYGQVLTSSGGYRSRSDEGAHGSTQADGIVGAKAPFGTALRGSPLSMISMDYSTAIGGPDPEELDRFPFDRPGMVARPGTATRPGTAARPGTAQTKSFAESDMGFGGGGVSIGSLTPQLDTYLDSDQVCASRHAWGLSQRPHAFG
jgi:hypothetical protein